ncbi:MAG: DNA-processing protein DprA [Bacteroidota bacterium]
MQEHKLHLLALSLTKGLGPVSVRNMIAFCGSAKAVFSTPRSKLLRAPGIGSHAITLLKKEQSMQRAEEEWAFCEKAGINILTYLDPEYPELLKSIYDAPLILFQKGELNLNAQESLAIVGTRNATDYGLELAAEFASFYARQGINVVSGLAFGIDVAAHKAVLQAGGKTTAVLAHGLHTIYPSLHRRKAEEITEAGALLTEYLGGTEPEAPFFPSRNRIVSGISRAVLVVEAGQKGGALITARSAFEQNRLVYAIPGRVGDAWSEGCNRLIRENIAKLVSHPSEILEDLDIQWQLHEDKSSQLELLLKRTDIVLSPNEQKLLALLEKEDVLLDKLSLLSGIPIASLNPLLLNMEFKDLVKQLPGKKYRRK